MALTVNTNVSALNAQRATLDSQNEMASAMERLATGKRINSARDDAAGLAIAARMESQVSGLNQAVRNANDAISLVQTAEGALQETTAILQRIRELSIQSAGGAPSNADRVNLNKEVVQLQEELARIANTTRFNGGLLLNGSFIDTDFQIGQSNNEEITVSIGDVRPERIGAYTQRTVSNVGLVTSGASLAEIDNGVQQQTLVMQVGTEVPRTVAINKGDDARTISDKMNQAGAQINSTASTVSDVYIDGYGSFSFKISSSSTPDIQDVITVGATAGSQAASLAAEINRGYSEHNISATLQVDDNGVEFVRMVQDDGYDVMIEDYVTTGDSALDFDKDGIAELTGSYGMTASVIGGSITIDAPASFLISSDDELNTILQGTRASLEVTGVSNDPAAYQDASFEVTVNGVTKTINLAAPPPETPRPAQSAELAFEFVATEQTRGPSEAQIGAVRRQPYALSANAIQLDGSGNPYGDASLTFGLSVNNMPAPVQLDMAAALYDTFGYTDITSSQSISAADFVDAMQLAINNSGVFDNEDAVTVSLTPAGQIKLEVAGGNGASGAIELTESTDSINAATNGLADFLTGSVTIDTAGSGTLGLTAGQASQSVVSGGELVLGSQVNELNTSGDDGPVNPFGLSLNESAGLNVSTNTIEIDSTAVPPNNTFTLAINGGAHTTFTLSDATYYSMEELAAAIQTAVDNSAFATDGNFPIQVTATADDNDDLGISFGSPDGYSIQVGTTGLFGTNGLDVQEVSSTPNLSTGASNFAEQTYSIPTLTLSNGQYSGDETTQFALSVNGSQLVDLDLAESLVALGYDYTSTHDLTGSEFVDVMQHAIDAHGAFDNDDAVTVSLTSQGLIQISNASSYALQVAEHSAQRASATDGLAEALTGVVSATTSGVSGLTATAGQGSASSATGVLVLGEATNNAVIGDSLGVTNASYVKPFGVAPFVIDSSLGNNSFSLVVDGGAPTTIPSGNSVDFDGNYFSMEQLAQAVEDAIEGTIQESGRVQVNAVLDSSTNQWGLSFTATDGSELQVFGDFITDADGLAIGTATSGAYDASGAAVSAANPIIVEAAGAAPVGPAGYRSEVPSGAFSDGIDLSSDNEVTIEILDLETGQIIAPKTVSLASSDGSVSYADFMNYLEAAANENFLDEGFTFATSGSDSSYTMTVVPEGEYQVTFSGASIDQAFGSSVTATGQASNMDGQVFTSMDDVVAELNAELAREGIQMAATYSRGGDTFNFTVTDGPADASSTISMSGDDLVNLGFTGSLEAIGGGVHRAEEVRYVSQIDISTRESASLAMTVVDAALETLASVRGGLGAVANRLESTISNLMNISENTSASMSRVMDADFAAESTRLARAQILQEASVAMLAQANQASQTVLKLLQ